MSDALPKILITRPREDGESLAEKLRQAHFAPTLLPMMNIRYHENPPDLADVGAFIFTSSHGVRALMHHLATPNPYRALPVYAVGEKTAKIAKEHGFENIFTAQGHAESLYALICQQQSPHSLLYHAAQSHHRHHLAEKLRTYGLEVRRELLYDAHPCETLPPDFMRTLPHFSAIMLFSPRTADIFLALLKKRYLQEDINYNITISLVCLSEQVKMHVMDFFAHWKPVQLEIRTETAKASDEAAMIDAMKNLLRA